MELDIGRLRNSHRLIGGGGVALFIFLFFFKWFGASASSTLPGGASISFGASVNGWHSLANTRWLLLVTIIVAVGLVVMVAAQRQIDTPAQPSVIVAGLGLLSAIFVLYRIIDHPHGGASNGLASFSYGAKIGLYLAFVACLVILYGGYLAMNEEGTSLSDVRDQASRAVSGVTSSEGPSSQEIGGSPNVTPPVPPAPVSSPPMPPPAAPSTSPPAGAGGSGEGPPSPPAF